MTLFSKVLVAALGSWLLSSSLWIYPHSLSYFNEAIGGPLHGPSHLLGSSVDWGQDLKYLVGDSFRREAPLVSASRFDVRAIGLLPLCNSSNPNDFTLNDHFIIVSIGVLKLAESRQSHDDSTLLREALRHSMFAQLKVEPFTYTLYKLTLPR